MLITWVSRKGLKRFKNNDAVALYENNKIFIAIAVDAAEKIIYRMSLTWQNIGQMQ
ncbi:hypothetical protein [Yersinia similis]|uniref:hypothetical protein n=1 Tax=Yersinia similis TaxID=367190 RepID=UPI0004ACA23D|nr:hypothetical protein [Yersinia similis]